MNIYQGKCLRTKQRYCFAPNKALCETADDYGVESIQEECEGNVQCTGAFVKSLVSIQFSSLMLLLKFQGS